MRETTTLRPIDRRPPSRPLWHWVVLVAIGVLLAAASVGALLETIR